MVFDPNQIAPNGMTYAQIDAEQGEHVRAANEALASMRDRDGRWWAYTASHRTFDMVIGEPRGHDNLVLCMAACDSISGPVDWPNQLITVLWRRDRESDMPWEFELRDESVGFRVVGGIFLWRRNFNLLTLHSLHLAGAG